MSLEGGRALWSISDLENLGALLIAKDIGVGAPELGVDPRGMALPRFFVLSSRFLESI